MFGGAVAAAPPKPTLLVTIVVDQYSANLFAEYRSQYRYGLATLTKGVVFPNGYQSHSATETCPGHSTILTGFRPSKTGIIANDWQDPNAPRAPSGSYSRYCIEEVRPDGVRFVSPRPLPVPTLGQRLHTADARSRTVAIGGKDRAAMMLSGGQDAYLTLWWAGTKGPRGVARFVTYDGAQVEPVMRNRIDEINAQVQSAYQTTQRLRLPAQCESRTRPVQVGKATVGELHEIPAGQTGRWRAMATLDRFILKAAEAAIDTLQLGKSGAVDVLAVSFSATDYVGHYYGNEGPEMCAQQIALDQTIQELLAHLDETGVSYVVALTADHGALDIPERNSQRGVATAERIDAELLPASLGEKIAKQVGLTEPAILGGKQFENDIYLAPSAERKRAAVIKALRHFYENHTQVAQVFTRKDLLAAKEPGGSPDQWTLLERARASFNEKRSGDLVVFLKPYVTHYRLPEDVDGDYIASHGSPWDYDRRVPILCWWHGVEGFEQPAAVETVDIAPTLAKLVGLKIEAPAMDGRVLPVVQTGD